MRLGSKHFIAINSAVGSAAFITGGTADVLGVSWGDSIRDTGAMLLVASFIRWGVRPALKAQSAVWSDAHQQGYDTGYKDGHREARPVVVPFRHRDVG